MSKQLENMNPVIKDMINKAVELDMIQASSVLEFAGMEDKQIAFRLTEIAYTNIHTDPKINTEICKLNNAFYKSIR